MPVGTVGPGGLELPQQLPDVPAGPAGGGGNDQDGCQAYLYIYGVRLKREGLKIGNGAEPATATALTVAKSVFASWNLFFEAEFS